MKTIKSITEQDMDALRTSAGQAGDFVQVAICDLALNGTFDRDDYTTLSRKEADRVSAMSQAQAIEACVTALNDGQG